MAFVRLPNEPSADEFDWNRVSHTPVWLRVFFSNLLCGCAGFAVVLPSLWPFMRSMGADTTTLACAVAMYSVGEGVGGKIVGGVYDRFPGHPKAILLGGMAVGLASALVYGLAPLFGPSGGPLVVVAARFFQGFDNGGRQTIEQSFLGTHVPAKHMATISSRLSSFAITGIMLGPTFGGPLQAVRLTVPGLGLPVDGNNAPGLFLALLCLVNIIMTAKFFCPGTMCSSYDASATLLGAAKTSARLAPPSQFGLLTCYAVFFANSVFIACLETITPVVLQRLYGWGPCLNPTECAFRPPQTYVNMLLSAGGMLSLACCLLMAFYLGRKVHGRETLCMSVGLAAPVLTNLANMDGSWFGSLPAWRFVASYCLGCFFAGFLRGPCYSLFSQIIGPHPKASYMGTSFFVGALPRIFGPFLFLALLDAPPSLTDVHFEHVYSGPAPRTWLLYGSMAAFNAATLLLVLAGGASGRLRPHPGAGGAGPDGLLAPLCGEAASPRGRCTPTAGGA